MNLAEVSDADLRAEVEGRHLLVFAWSEPGWDGCSVSDPERPYSFNGTYSGDMYVWKTDVAWLAVECEACDELAVGVAYLTCDRYHHFCREHLPKLSATWNAIYSNSLPNGRHWKPKP